MASRKNLWEVLNSDISRLLIGFLLTTVIGTVLVQSYQDRNWEKQRQFEVLRRKLDAAEKFIEEISDLMNTRVMQLRRVEGLITSGNRAEALKAWQESSEVKQRWNVKLGVFQNKTRRLVGEDMGGQLNNYETDDTAIQKPTSVHGHFFVTNRIMLQIMRCLEQPGCQPSGAQLKEMHERLNALDIATDAFVDRASDMILTTALQLEGQRFEQPKKDKPGT